MMSWKKLTIEFDHTKCLLVYGPARLRVISGDAYVFAYHLLPGKSIFVKRYKCMPVETDDHVKLELMYGGEDCKLVSMKENVGTKSWEKVVSDYMDSCGDAIVVGSVDSGKTSFTTFLVNKLLRKNIVNSVGVIDADPGQGDIGVPGFIGLVLTEKPIFDLEEVKPYALQFFGSLSPHPYEVVLEKCISKLIEKARKSCDVVIINFHGWTSSEKAFEHVKRVILQNGIQNVFAIDVKDLASFLKSNIESIRIYYLEKPQTYQRSRKIRKEIRQRKYKRWINDCDGLKLIRVPINLVELYSQRVRGDIVWISEDVSLYLPQIIGDFYEENLDIQKVNWIWKLHGEGKSPYEEYIIKLTKEYIFRLYATNTKRIYILGKRCGIIVGLYHKGSWYMGILESFNIKDNELFIYVPKFMDLRDIKSVKIGRVLLNCNGDELGILPAIKLK